MTRWRIILASAILVTSMIASGSANAQEGSPAAGTAVPEPTACTAEPRDLEATLALWFDAAGAPVATPAMAAAVADETTLPDGPRADDATAAAITETTQNWVYCIEVAGEFARGFSYVTDDLLAQFGPDLTNPAQDSPDEVRAALEGQLLGTPIAGTTIGGRMPPLSGPRKPRLLEDGRVAAMWSFGGDRVFFIYELVGDRWLIDEAIDIIDTAATPIAGAAEATPAP